jgi:hypothetical protein
MLTDKVAQLENALATVMRLRGVVPICMYCKRIKGSNEEWLQLDADISEYSEITFSHGICPECLEHNLSVMADN